MAHAGVRHARPWAQPAVARASLDCGRPDERRLPRDLPRVCPSGLATAGGAAGLFDGSGDGAARRRPASGRRGRGGGARSAVPGGGAAHGHALPSGGQPGQPQPGLCARPDGTDGGAVGAARGCLDLLPGWIQRVCQRSAFLQRGFRRRAASGRLGRPNLWHLPLDRRLRLFRQSGRHAPRGGADPRARFCEMPELGHFPMLEDPKRLLAYLRPELAHILSVRESA